MKNLWLVVAFIAGVIAVVVIAFNSENQRKMGGPAENMPAEVEYEDEPTETKESASVVSSETEVASKNSGVVQEVKQDAAESALETYQAVKPAAEPVVEKVSVAGAEGISDFSGVSYTIQVVSVKELKDAQRALADVLKKNHPGHIVQRDLGDMGVWYRVYIGKFDTKTDADAYLVNVHKDFSSAFVIVPSKKKQ